MPPDDAIDSDRAGSTAGSIRDIWWLTISMFLIRIGSSTTAVALPLFVLQRYGLGIGAGLAIGLRLAPNILLGPLVGNLVDRWDPRRVAVLSSVASGVVVGLFPFTHALWQVQVLSVLGGVAYMFGYPARMALRPLAMSEQTLVKGNSMLVTSERLTTLLGPASAGPIIAFIGLDWLFWIEVMAALAAAGFVLLLPKAPVAEKSRASKPTTSDAPEDHGLARPPSLGAAVRRWLGGLGRLFTGGLREMVSIIRTDGMMLALTATAFSYVAAIGISTTFLSKFSLTDFAGIPGAYGYLVAAMGAGGVLGGLLAGRLGRLHQGLLYLIGNVAEGVLWLVFAMNHGIVVGLVLMLLAGACESAATVVYFAEAQKRIPAGYTGRYYATFVPLTDMCTMAGTTLGPVLLLGLGLGLTAAVICALIAIPVLLFARPLLVPPAVREPLAVPG